MRPQTNWSRHSSNREALAAHHARELADLNRQLNAAEKNAIELEGRLAVVVANNGNIGTPHE